jgi:hypothetical protein
MASEVDRDASADKAGDAGEAAGPAGADDEHFRVSGRRPAAGGRRTTVDAGDQALATGRKRQAALRSGSACFGSCACDSCGSDVVPTAPGCRGSRAATNTPMSQTANASTGMTTRMARWPAESAELGYGPMEVNEYGDMVASL